MELSIIVGFIIILSTITIMLFSSVFASTKLKSIIKSPIVVSSLVAVLLDAIGTYINHLFVDPYSSRIPVIGHFITIYESYYDFHFVMTYNGFGGYRTVRDLFWIVEELLLIGACIASFIFAYSIAKGKKVEFSTSMAQTIESTPKPREIEIIEEIKKLKTLLDQGVITQEEFDSKKKQILG